jgi:hypothetical protein
VASNRSGNPLAELMKGEVLGQLLRLPHRQVVVVARDEVFDLDTVEQRLHRHRTVRQDLLLGGGRSGEAQHREG